MFSMKKEPTRKSAINLPAPYNHVIRIKKLSMHNIETCSFPYATLLTNLSKVKCAWTVQIFFQGHTLSKAILASNHQEKLVQLCWSWGFSFCIMWIFYEFHSKINHRTFYIVDQVIDSSNDSVQELVEEYEEQNFMLYLAKATYSTVSLKFCFNQLSLEIYLRQC